MSRRLLLAFTLALAALATASTPANAAVQWTSSGFWAPSNMNPGGEVDFIVGYGNKGTTQSAGNVTVKVALPPGLTYKPLSGQMVSGAEIKSCSGTGTITCTIDGTLIQPSKVNELGFKANVHPEASPGTYEVTTTVSGGGALGAPWTQVSEALITEAPTLFGFRPGTLKAGAFDEEGNDYTQAGGHATTASGALEVNLERIDKQAGGAVKDIVAELPPGFVGDPTALPRCSATFEDCGPDNQIGYVKVRVTFLSNFQYYAVYNLQPPPNEPALFGFEIDRFKITAHPSVRSDGDYGIRLKIPNNPETFGFSNSSMVIWGTPASPIHDSQRCYQPNTVALACNGINGDGNPGPTNVPHASTAQPAEAFLSNPTDCADRQESIFRLSNWASPPVFDGGLVDFDPSDPAWHSLTVVSPNVTGCDEVPFDPSFTLEPTAKAAESPTGLDAHLSFPREADSDPAGLIQAHLKKSTVVLPEGMSANAAAANGREACSASQIGLKSAPGALPVRFDNGPTACPDSAKIATAEIETPLLENHLEGSVYLASQDDNPFGTLLAIYIVVEEPSIRVKLAGKVIADPVTGQLTTIVDDNPQLPFSDLDIHFFDGPRAALATPSTCGTHVTHTESVPWSAADPRNPAPEEIVTIDDPFQIDSGPNGSPCVGSLAQRPFDLGLKAGSTNPSAGAHTDFTIRLTRPDDAQEIDRVEVKTPQGFTASLRGVPYCPESSIALASSKSGKAEQESPSCPVASRVASTTVGAGAGPAPVYVPGEIYLSGPYKGAPLSLVAITPAVAGPFDLGTEVDRVALRVDPRTAQITALSDPLPRIKRGIPLKIRDIRIDLDRPGFALNPTDCSEQRVTAEVLGSDGAIADLSDRFQVGGCEKLGFRPALSFRLKGGARRGAHPALTATLKARPGDANIADASVTLPRSAFLDQGHIRTICTRVQFAADACPPGSIYGYAKAVSPLLDEPLQGPVILRSSDNNLPDMVADLGGQIPIEIVGRIDSKKGGIRNTFDVVPDAPVSEFTLTLKGAQKGLIVNSRNLCSKPSFADVKMGAHNGLRHDFKAKVRAGCKTNRPKRHAKRSHR